MYSIFMPILQFFSFIRGNFWKAFVAIAVLFSGCSESFDAQLFPSQKTKAPQYWELKEKSVYDGDTFRVFNPAIGEELKIRLACIDAPEKTQQLGIASRDYLRSLLNKNPKKLIVQRRDTDRYGRIVAEVFIPTEQGDEEIPVNAMMIKDGMAYFYEDFAKSCSDNAQLYANLEKEAQRSRAGVWKNPNSIKPWDYRKKNK